MQSRMQSELVRESNCKCRFVWGVPTVPATCGRQVPAERVLPLRETEDSLVWALLRSGLDDDLAVDPRMVLADVVVRAGLVELHLADIERLKRSGGP